MMVSIPTANERHRRQGFLTIEDVALVLLRPSPTDPPDLTD